MRALHFDGADLRCIDDHPEPSPAADEAVVRVHLAGVCSTAAPLVINEITLIGSRCGLFPPALRALADRSVDVTPLIDAKFPLAGGVDALAHAARPGVRKVLIGP